MLRSFLLITLRNILKNKGASYLNISALTLSTATCLFIFHYIYFESNYDSSPALSDVYRVETVVSTPQGASYRDAFTTIAAGPTLQQDLPQIEAYTRLVPYSEGGSGNFKVLNEGGQEQRVYIEKVYYSEEQIFEVFELPLVAGDPQTALSTANSILLSASTVQDIFGQDWKKDAVIGTKFTTTASMLASQEYTITGIFADRPGNTHLPFDALVTGAFQEAPIAGADGQLPRNTYTYLRAPVSATALSQHTQGLADSGHEMALALRPIADIHLAEKISNEPEAGANQQLLIFLASIGFIILLLATTNYTNNAIFSSMDRAREIGMRKVLGIRSRQLIATFIGEAFFINLIAAALAMVLFLFGINLTKIYTSIEIPEMTSSTWSVYLVFQGLVVVVCTLFSGIYPALYFNGLSAIPLLKGTIQLVHTKVVGGAGRAIKTLLIFQIAVSILFVSGIYIVRAQLQYMEKQGKRPFDLRVRGIFPGAAGANSTFTNQAFSAIDQIKSQAVVEEVELSNQYQGQIKVSALLPISPIGAPPATAIDARLLAVDPDYWMDSSLVAGYNFSSHFGRNADHVLLNTQAVEALGFDHPDSVAGELLVVGREELKVIGVVNDPSDETFPKVYATGFRYRTYAELMLHYQARNGQTVDQFLDAVEVSMSSALPFFSLLSRDYKNERVAEQNILKLFLFFSLLAITIASMGLLGLSTFITQKRAKEIGLRKVLGATTLNTMMVLLYDFLKLVGTAAIVALPLVLLGSRKWLENYRYRITIEPQMLALPLLIITTLALLVIARRCWKAAVTSPIQALQV